ncbi:MAG: TraR/DksA family transcriptional regulator [Candidatus Acidiferrales bacterium]
MHATELRKYKGLLVEKRQELQTLGLSDGAVIPGAGGFEGDEVEQANADAEAELQIRLHQTDGRLLRAIDDALGRIRHHKFGVCELCKRPISKARLEAVPWTRHCRACKERASGLA